jgi:hypothetical protein
MYKDKFVLSIIHDGSPVKETGYRSSKEVAIPFDSEYKIRLKNKNNRSCTARVFVDGTKVSQLGDFIIHAGGTVDLERFVDQSLTNGKKFRFVSLDNKDVDDPTSSDNGIIKVEFRLAKERNGIKILPSRPWPDPPKSDWPENKPYHWEDNNGTTWWRWEYVDDKTTGGDAGNVWDGTTTVHYCNSDFNVDDCAIGARNTNRVKKRNMRKSCSYTQSAPVMDCMVESGATIEGGKSNQTFSYSDLEVDESHVTTLRLKIVGISNERSMNRHKYCTNCGNKVSRTYKYCPNCGHRR